MSIKRRLTLEFECGTATLHADIDDFAEGVQLSSKLGDKQKIDRYLEVGDVHELIKFLKKVRNILNEGEENE